MKYATLTPGFVGISEGDNTINAIAIGTDGEAYMIPVTPVEAEFLVEWDKDGREDVLTDVFEDFTHDIDLLLYDGTVPHEDLFSNTNGIN